MTRLYSILKSTAQVQYMLLKPAHEENGPYV